MRNWLSKKNIDLWNHLANATGRINKREGSLLAAYNFALHGHTISHFGLVAYYWRKLLDRRHVVSSHGLASIHKRPP
jgi:hypothetical protein